MKRLVWLGVTAAILVAVPGCGSDSESVAPLQCPAAGSEAAKAAPAQLKVSTRSVTDEIAMGDDAKLQVDPGAGMGGNIIVCGRRATLILRDTVKRAAILGQESAQLVLQDDTPGPLDLDTTGKSVSTVRCNKEKHESDRPPCDNFFLS